MGRRCTAQDCNRTAAGNGWVPGAHEEEDRIQQTKDEPGERYKKSQQEALDQWIMWVPDSEGPFALGPALFPPGMPTKLPSFMSMQGRSSLRMPAREMPSS